LDKRAAMECAGSCRYTRVKSSQLQLYIKNNDNNTCLRDQQNIFQLRTNVYDYEVQFDSYQRSLSQMIRSGECENTGRRSYRCTLRCNGREASWVRWFKYVFRENMEIESRENDKQIKRKSFRDFLWYLFCLSRSSLFRSLSENEQTKAMGSGSRRACFPH